MKKYSAITTILGMMFISNLYAAPNVNHRAPIIDDYVNYQIGGGNVVPYSPTDTLPNQLTVGASWKGDFMCGNFDFDASIMEDVAGKAKETFNSLYSNVIQSAQGAVASLPALAIQRANPQLYDMLTNGLYQAKLDFADLKTSCEELGNKAMDIAADGKWREAAKLENWKNKLSKGKNLIAKNVKKETEEDGGKNGVTWVGNEKRGGENQKPIKVVNDVVSAGYNILQNRSSLDNSSIASSSCSNRLCATWKNPKEAAEWTTDVIGDQTETTCDNCGDKKSTKAGVGLTQKIDKESLEVKKSFQKALNANRITNEMLANISSSTLPITRNVLEKLRDEPNAALIATKLSNEVALSRVLEKALMARRSLIAGMREPYVANQTQAVDTAEKYLTLLDREINQIKLELDLQKALGNNTALLILNRAKANAAAVSSSAMGDAGAITTLDKAPEQKQNIRTFSTKKKQFNLGN